jgi:hypothetical protein
MKTSALILWIVFGAVCMFGFPLFVYFAPKRTSRLAQFIRGNPWISPALYALNFLWFTYMAFRYPGRYYWVMAVIWAISAVGISVPGLRRFLSSRRVPRQ